MTRFAETGVEYLKLAAARRFREYISILGTTGDGSVS
jgi:hypothetical protein